MLLALLLILALLWILGYIPITFYTIPQLPVFSINNHTITLWNLIMLAIILAIVGILPRPLREIAGILLLFWILSLLGIFFFAGLSNVVVLVLIIGVLLVIFTGVT